MSIKQYFFLMGLMMVAILCNAQDTLVHDTPVYDPHLHKLIPDKVFEFGIPMLFLILLLNTIVTVLKNRADHQLKLKMIEKGIADETLIEIFKESNAMLRLQPLKYFLLCSSLGISFVIIHFCQDFLINKSGYFALGIILILTSVAFFIYYSILQKKL